MSTKEIEKSFVIDKRLVYQIRSAEKKTEEKHLFQNTDALFFLEMKHSLQKKNILRKAEATNKTPKTRYLSQFLIEVSLKTNLLSQSVNKTKETVDVSP